MMSDFKAPVAAAILSRVDAGTLSLSQTLRLTPADVVPGSAVPSIGDRVQKGAETFTVDQLLTASVSQSDNTSVDALIRLIGGPGQVARFLQQKGLSGMQIRMDERGIAKIFTNLHGASTPPKGETSAQENHRLREGYAAFLAAPPNQTSPETAALFLQKLWGNELLSPASTQHLLRLMYAQTTPHRLRDGIPPHARLADKTGTASTVDGRTAAYNDMGLITWPDGRAVIVTVYLKDSRASQERRDALFADLARTATSALQRPGE